MKKLLLVMGDLATGKTAFAGVLAKRYNANVFNKDSIKEVLGDTIGFSNREENLKLSKASVELMFLIFKEVARIDKDLVLEANFHAVELEHIHALAKENGYEVLTLVLRGDMEILHKRYLNRIYYENRHPVHLSTTLDIFEDFKAYTEVARKEEVYGNSIEIDANDFAYQQNKTLLSQIDEFMGVHS